MWFRVMIDRTSPAVTIGGRMAFNARRRVANRLLGGGGTVPAVAGTGIAALISPSFADRKRAN